MVKETVSPTIYEIVVFVAGAEIVGGIDTVK